MVEQKYPLNLLWPSPTELVDFIDELRDAGYKIGIDHYIAAQDLLLVFFTQTPVPEPKRLKSLLGPLLCSSPTEQADFPQRFDQWLTRSQESSSSALESQVVSETVAITPTRKISPKLTRQGILLGISVLILTTVLSYYYINSNAIDSGSITQSDSTITQTLTPTSTSVIGTPSPTVTTSSSTASTTTNYRWSWFLLLSLLVFLLPMLLWQLWWFYRAHLFLMRHADNRQPEFEKLTLKGNTIELFPPLTLLQLARNFRQRNEVDTLDLDTSATVTQTVQRAGWFTPVYSHRQITPEYLVLIDRSSRRDQQAKFITELIQRLEAHQVFLRLYYFAGDPRICFAANDSEQPSRLSDLFVRYPDHRLLLFTDARGLFNALTGQFEPWIEQLTAWNNRFLMTPEPIGYWGQREQELADNFIVLPATTTGLSQLTFSLQQPVSYPTQDTKAQAPLPIALLTRSQRWLDREPPQPTQIDELITELEYHLGKMGFIWLSACAVYPALDWHLTLYLGSTLVTEKGEKYLQPERLLELARLPWLRYNYMPDWLRKRLLQTLPSEADRAIRAALKKLLLTAMDDGEEIFALELARYHPLRMLAKPLLYLLPRPTKSDSPLRDYIFLNFMIGKRSSGLAVALPAQLLALLVNKGSQNNIIGYLSNLQLYIKQQIIRLQPLISLSQRGNSKPPIFNEVAESIFPAVLESDKEGETAPEKIEIDGKSVQPAAIASHIHDVKTESDYALPIAEQRVTQTNVPLRTRMFGPFRYQLPDSAPFTETRMSLLWLAEALDTQHKMLGEKVVLKVARLKEEQFSLANQRAIENEVRWLRQLDHPGIIKLRPIAEEETARPGLQIYQARSSLPGEPWFVVTDYLPGGTLVNLVEERKKLSVRLALQIAHRLAETLAYVHTQGCIHRDFKPQNVLFVQKPDTRQLTEQSRPILIDFGLANHGGEQLLVAGTEPWLAPECKHAWESGTKLAASPSMDMYALGLTLYYMLSGQRPPKATPNLAAKLWVQPGDLVDVAAQQRAAVATAINQLIHKSIDDEPNKRLSAQQFAVEIERSLPLTFTGSRAWLVTVSILVGSIVTVIIGTLLIMYRNALSSLIVVGQNWIIEMFQNFRQSIPQPSPTNLIILIQTILIIVILIYFVRRRSPANTDKIVPTFDTYTEPARNFYVDDATKPTKLPAFSTIAPAYLLYEEGGNHLPKKLPIDAGREIRIGRRREYCDLILNDKRISRLHAVITEKLDGFYIRDEGSTGGTWVNRRRLGINTAGRLLKHGDIINFNTVVYRFELAEQLHDTLTPILTDTDYTEPIVE